jgi:hypothetical protein
VRLPNPKAWRRRASGWPLMASPGPLESWWAKPSTSDPDVGYVFANAITERVTASWAAKSARSGAVGGSFPGVACHGDHGVVDLAVS